MRSLIALSFFLIRSISHQLHASPLRQSSAAATVMTPSLPKNIHDRLWRAHGGLGSATKPRRPSPSHLHDWIPGHPTHWQEQTVAAQARSLILRVALTLHICCTLSYLVYRSFNTMGKFPDSRGGVWFVLQITFFAFEVVVWAIPIVHAIEVWNVVQRNCIDFKRIPNDMIAPYFTHDPERGVPECVCNYPAVDVVIPCYNEDADMVLQVVQSALDLDYPAELLEVHLCDDGKDDVKRQRVENLQRFGKFNNVHYVTRPDNSFAKAGNVNHTLRRTSGHLVVQLDADFIARPFLLQRLLSYFFVWNDDTHQYDFNQTLAYVQTPQHYRNLAPHDADIFDQRNVALFTRYQQGRDWLNAATMVGTSNLINRQAIEEAGYFPYHSKGDDIGMSVLMHGCGYRSYHTTESVATGLVPPSLRGNFAQRRRWYTTDFEILFSRHGSLTQRGLSMMQRYLYFGIVGFRFLNITMFLIDILMILVLLTGFFVVDVVQPKTFIVLVTLHLVSAQLPRAVECFNDRGVFKSMAGSELFEIIFRYSTMKGLFDALFSPRMRWKTAEKTLSSQTHVAGHEAKVSNETMSEKDDNTKRNACQDGQINKDRDIGNDVKCQGNVALNDEDDKKTRMSSSLSSKGDDDRGNNCSDKNNHGFNSIRPSIPTHLVMDPDIETNAASTYISSSSSSGTQAIMPIFSRGYFHFVLHNLKRCWYNLLMCVIFTVVLIIGIVRPADFRRTLDDGTKVQYNNVVSVVMAFGHLSTALVAHVVVIVLCFKRQYLTGWTLPDLANGRCDGNIVKKDEKGVEKVYVPQSIVSYISIGRTGVLLGALVYTIVVTITDGIVDSQT